MAGRSPEAIAKWLEESLYKFDGPGQYLGTEPNSERREWGSTLVRTLLAASWDYSQAAGNMAVPALYDALHKAWEFNLADRWYLPATQRDMDLLEKAQVPVFGIESRHQLRDFDVVGTSISYTVLFMNFCKFLSMSGVPLRWRDREKNAGDYPMVMVGGQAYCQPEFMAPVVDCVWLGEAEDEEGNPGLSEVTSRIGEYKVKGDWQDRRILCYTRLAREFPFLYFPRFVSVTYRYEDRGLPRKTKVVSGFRSRLAAVTLPQRARRVANLGRVDLMTSAPVLFSDPGMGSGDVEVARGCDCWCTFCKLTWVTKPYRQEPVARSVERAGAWRRNMGSTDISLVAPDPPVHTEKQRLIAALLENVTDRVDASSMRIDDYSAGDFSALLQVSGTTAITLGLEGNSQRMRDLAGKGTSDDDVADAVTKAIRAGVRKVKLYFITNWPGEERADVMRIVELGKRLADIRDSFGEGAKGVQIIFSWTPLLIEAQTPMQWFEVTPPDYALAEAFRELMENHRIWVKIGSKAQPEKLAFFQACQRASRDAGEAVVDVIESYGTASWGGFPKDMRDRLDAALAAHGFLNGLDDIFGERFEHDLLGWEMIDTGVRKSLMWRVYRDMVEMLESTDPETYDDLTGEGYHGNEWVPRCNHQCSGTECGACSRDDLELRRLHVQAVDRDLQAEPVVPVDHSTVALKVRMRVQRPEESRFVTNESLAFIVRRAAYLAEQEMDGAVPPIAARSVKLASGGTGYRERSAGADYVEFGLTRPVSSEIVRDFLFRMVRHWSDGSGHTWLEWEGCEWDILPASARLPSRAPSLWSLEVADAPEAVAARLEWWAVQASVPVLIRAESFYAGATAKKGDAKEHVADFWVAREGRSTVLRMVLTGQLGPYQAYTALMGRASSIEAARFTALREEFFIGSAGSCQGCGGPIPSSLTDVPWSARFCPRCGDAAEGKVIAALAGVLQVPVPHSLGRSLWKTPCKTTVTGRGPATAASRRPRPWTGRRPVAMTAPPEFTVEESVACPHCGGTAEPEQAGNALYFACGECGAEFGYRIVTQEAPACAAGLPVEIVARASQPPGVLSLESGGERRSVFLGTTISRRPS